jgi:hypothetical protein
VGWGCGAVAGQVEEGLPLETCDTLHANGAWGYTADHTPRPIDQVVKLLVRTAGFDANLLLNVGPRPDGLIQEEFQETLHQLGAWMRQFGHTIYDTRGGPMRPTEWGVATRRGDRLWVHVLEWPQHLDEFHIALPGIKYQDVRPGEVEVESCHEPLCRYSQQDVQMLRDADTDILELKIAVAIRDDFDTILAFTLINGGGASKQGRQEL